MMRRRKWPLKNLESSRALRTTTIVYLSFSLVLICFTTIAYFTIDMTSQENRGSITAAMLEHSPLFLCLSYSAGMGLIAFMSWKCRYCRSGPGRRIESALQKMSKGDLGWKITLRRGDELADVADSVTRASELLAERISKLQCQTRQLTEIENYLIDSVDTDRISNPYTLKALRKLKICTSRLNSDMEDFQVSTLSTMTTGNMNTTEETERELEKV